MSTVSSNDQATYAAAKQVLAKPVLNVEPLDEVATATLNIGGNGTATYPLTSVEVRGQSADWLSGNENMMFRIQDGNGTIASWGVLNQDNANGTLFPDVKSDGDFGYATNIGIPTEDDYTVRIYRNRPNWGMISRVTEAGIQAKRWNKIYTNEGTSPPPVVIIGHDQQADIDTGTSLATFSFDATDSYDWVATNSITTFLYTLPTGAVVTGGSINTASVDFTVPAGVYTVECTITSSSGVSRSGFRTIYANDTSANKSFGDTYSIQAIAADVTDINGWQGQFTVLGDISSVIYPGAKCHWYVPVHYDGARLTDNDAFIDVFVGYLSDISVTTDSQKVKTSTLTFKSPLKLAQLLPSATQMFEEVASPTAWTEVTKNLSDPAYAAYYILQYHTTMLDNHDIIYESAIRELRRRVFGFPADNINAHLQLVGQLMSGNVGCRSDGAITITQEPSLQNTTTRNTRDEKYTWTEDSLRERLSIAPNFRPKIAYLIMGAVAYDGNPNAPMITYAAKAPGQAQAQGVTKPNLPDISITLNGGAAELYGIIGHQFALLNSPLSKLDTPVAKMFDIGDPADADWHTLNISESDYLPINMDKFGVRWASTMRMRPTRVTRQWQKTKGSWVKQITQQNRIESFGRPGVFHPTYKGQLQPYLNPLSGWLDGLQITMPDLNIDFDTAAGGLPTSGDWNKAWSFNDFGISGYSSDWNGSSPSYTGVGTALPGDVAAQTFDGGGGGDGYLVKRAPGTTTDFEYSLYENPGVASDKEDWTLDHGWSPGDWPDTDTNRKSPVSLASNAEQTMQVSIEESQVYYQYKAAAGSWNAQAQVGDGDITYSGGKRPPPPIALDSTSAWTVGRAPTGARGYILMEQTSLGGAWTHIVNPVYATGNGNVIPSIVREGTDIFVSYPDNDPAAGTLYRIDDATTTWTDITPAGGYIPQRYNALVASGADVRMIGTNPNGEKKLFSSDDSGDTWDDLDATAFDWLVRLSSNDVFALGGNGFLNVTNNGFGTDHSRLGQWGKIGSIGIMQGFASEAL